VSGSPDWFVITPVIVDTTVDETDADDKGHVWAGVGRSLQMPQSSVGEPFTANDFNPLYIRLYSPLMVA